MSEDDKKPKLSQQFNKEVFEQPIADKDNTDRRLKPKEYQIQFEPQFAPTGSLGIKARPQTPDQEDQRITASDQSQIDLSRKNITLEEPILGHQVLVRIEDEPIPTGIDGGRVSILTLVNNETGKPVVHFDKGEWRDEPSTPLENQIVMDVLDEHNGIEVPNIEPAFGRNRDHDRDIDR